MILNYFHDVTIGACDAGRAFQKRFFASPRIILCSTIGKAKPSNLLSANCIPDILVQDPLDLRRRSFISIVCGHELQTILKMCASEVDFPKDDFM
jgi:hypothetical protein